MPGQMSDIEHVVILMQENRSFDHYYGTMHGVKGFADPDIMIQPTGLSVLYQTDPTAVQDSSVYPYVLPWHFDTTATSAQSFGGLSHAWGVEHPSWNNGLMDGFVASHRVGDDATSGTNNAPGTMAYFKRSDIPYQYALADAFTICDGYHASVLGPTSPNRIMLMSGTVDPEGVMGGPCLDNSQVDGQLKWESYPELLQKAGIDWYLYQETDNFTDNMLTFFEGFNADKTSDLYRRGNTFIDTPKGIDPGPTLAAKLKEDVLAGKLPQVSYIVGGYVTSEHPAARPADGAKFISQVIDALTADPAVWAKTVLFINFDENDGFFDHVLPPTAPAGTPGEYVTQQVALANVGATDSFDGPVGLSFRVPMTIVSPWTRGGYVCSDTFDHTSVIMFLEKRFGVHCPNISDWRRSTVGDLTSAFNFAGGADLSAFPTLPDAEALSAAAAQQASLPAAVAPATPTLPVVEPGGPRRKPSGIVAVAPAVQAGAGTAAGGTTTSGTTTSGTTTSGTTTSGTTGSASVGAAGAQAAPAGAIAGQGALAQTGGLPEAVPAVALLAAGALSLAALRNRRSRVEEVEG